MQPNSQLFSTFSGLFYFWQSKMNTDVFSRIGYGNTHGLLGFAAMLLFIPISALRHLSLVSVNCAFTAVKRHISFAINCQTHFNCVNTNMLWARSYREYYFILNKELIPVEYFVPTNFQSIIISILFR